MSQLTSHELNYLRTKLIENEQHIERHLQLVDHYGLDASLKENTGELSGIDNHPADVGTEMFERSKDFAIDELHEMELERIHTALAHMEKGTYGVCVVCGQPIPFERLEAVPSTMYCVQHSPDHFSANPRPIEEEFLDPPFGRTSLDELDTQNGFDGEDAWQIVESWGTSNTPALHEDYNVTSYNELYIEAADELEGFVEPYESFLATDITGHNLHIVRNHQYEKYVQSGEGEPLLEADQHIEDLED